MSVLPDSMAVIILAAGAGSRLGGGKLMLMWQGKPIVRHVLDTAMAVSVYNPVIAVVGCESEQMRSHLARDSQASQNLLLVENQDWKTGQSSSLRAGIETLVSMPGSSHLKGVIIMLGDQPLIMPETLTYLASQHVSAHAKATAPFFGNRRGNPVILSPELFSDVLLLGGDKGARELIAGLGDTLNRVDVDDPGVVKDIDTQDDYYSLKKLS